MENEPDAAMRDNACIATDSNGRTQIWSRVALVSFLIAGCARADAPRPVTSPVAQERVDAASRDVCLHLQEIIDARAAQRDVPQATDENPSEEDKADSSRLDNAAKESALALQQAAIRIPDDQMKNDARFIARAILSGVLPDGRAAETPEIVDRLADSCTATGTPLISPSGRSLAETDSAINWLPW